MCYNGTVEKCEEVIRGIMNGQSNGLSPERVLEELQAIGFVRASDFLSAGEDTLTLKAYDALTPAQSAAVASMEVTKTGVKVKFYDKLKALELMGRHFGLFDGSGAQPKDSNLLQVLLEQTQKEADTHDIPELQPAAAAGHELVESTGTA